MKAKIELEKNREKIKIILSGERLIVEFSSKMDAANFYKATKIFFKEKGFMPPAEKPKAPEREERKYTRIYGKKVYWEKEDANPSKR